ncbi:MAG: FAD-dependent oxidoreductase [bacterium]
MIIQSLHDLDLLRQTALASVAPHKPMISVGLGTCGIGNDADKVFEAFGTMIKKMKAPVALKRTGCFGFCAEEPLVMLYLPGKPILLFSKFQVKQCAEVLKAATNSQAAETLSKNARAKIEAWDFVTGKVSFGTGYPETPAWNEIPFFKGQKKIVLRDCGLIDPESIEDYIAVGGYAPLAKALLKMTPTQVIETVKDSKLRGRGGAGFPTGRKWEMMQAQTSPGKFIICNADEGDPGAYMNRNEIESDPHMLIEGMAIGAYAMGTPSGIVYIRAEYPLAVERLNKAIQAARSRGLLGKNILGSGFSFDIEIIQGAGAFVCGEETALIASAESKAGRPLPRPPYPAERGYNNSPTNINNVETLCNVPAILSAGSGWFNGIGTAQSAGTKVFSLVGKVKNTGLVELPLGTPIETIVYGMGEGTGSFNKKIKAVQTGGPSGGCIPVEHFKTPVDYDSLAALGAIMGSGGMVVMDQDNCMVDVARYFVGFTAAESCGKCTSCREGLSQSLRLLTSISNGKGTEKDIAELEALAQVIRDSSLCGLGQTAANPVLTTLKYFKDEYLEHIRERRCSSGACESLYLALCENSCPLHMNIPGYLTLLKEGRIEDAFELTLRDNPFPGSIGRVCHFHCQMRCRREDLDQAVAQNEIHRYLADTMYKMGKEKAIYKKLIDEKQPATGRKIAIVGAGPAGLTAAFYLARLGHSVSIYDEHKKAGGIMRYGIPAYRLPREVMDKEVDFIKKLGVRFVFETRVGKDIPLKTLAKQNDAVIIAIGAQEDQKIGLPGEELKGVYPGYHFLEAFNMQKTGVPGKKTLIIGGGNVAIDAARTLWRLGSDVTVTYRRGRSDMPANATELDGAEDEGVRFMYMMAPEAFLGDAKGRVRAVRFQQMKPGTLDKSGRPTPIPTGQTIEIPCDAVLLAIGERVGSKDLPRDGIECARNGTVRIDNFTLKTTAPNIYAVGDAVTGPATASEAMGLAKRAAQAIDKQLTGEDRFSKLFRKFDYGMEVPLNPKKCAKVTVRDIPVKERCGNFTEIMQGYSGQQARSESLRCLRCDVRDNARVPW